MATVINNPGSSMEPKDSSGAWMGIIILIVAILGLMYFFMPYFRGGSTNLTPGSAGTSAPTNVQNNTTEEAPPAEGVDINVPDRIDVNVDTSPMP